MFILCIAVVLQVLVMLFCYDQILTKIFMKTLKVILVHAVYLKCVTKGHQIICCLMSRGTENRKKND